MQKTRFPAVISTFIVCYAFWILLTWNFSAQELAAGAIVSLAVALFSARFFVHEHAFHFFNPVHFFSLLAYIPVFMWELLKANWDVAKRCFGDCKKKVNPGIVKVPVNLGDGYPEAMLANSITLTPGTITLDITEEEGQDYFYIHWIDVSETDRDKAGEMIKGTLEKWIRRINDRACNLFRALRALCAYQSVSSYQRPHRGGQNGRGGQRGYPDILRDDTLRAVHRQRNIPRRCDNQRAARHYKHHARRALS